jgi:ribosomal protein S27E
MSAETTIEAVEAEAPKEGFMRCPECGYEIPDNLVVCWKCGTVLKKSS